jgi:hypothetical protein
MGQIPPFDRSCAPIAQARAASDSSISIPGSATTGRWCTSSSRRRAARRDIRRCVGGASMRTRRPPSGPGRGRFIRVYGARRSGRSCLQAGWPVR